MQIGRCEAWLCLGVKTETTEVFSNKHYGWYRDESHLFIGAGGTSNLTDATVFRTGLL